MKKRRRFLNLTLKRLEVGVQNLLPYFKAEFEKPRERKRKTTRKKALKRKPLTAPSFFPRVIEGEVLKKTVVPNPLQKTVVQRQTEINDEYRRKVQSHYSLQVRRPPNLPPTLSDFNKAVMLKPQEISPLQELFMDIARKEKTKAFKKGDYSSAIIAALFEQLFTTWKEEKNKI